MRTALQEKIFNMAKGNPSATNQGFADEFGISEETAMKEIDSMKARGDWPAPSGLTVMAESTILLSGERKDVLHAERRLLGHARGSHCTPNHEDIQPELSATVHLACGVPHALDEILDDLSKVFEFDREASRRATINSRSGRTVLVSLPNRCLFGKHCTRRTLEHPPFPEGGFMSAY